MLPGLALREVTASSSGDPCRVDLLAGWSPPSQGGCWGLWKGDWVPRCPGACCPERQNDRVAGRAVTPSGGPPGGQEHAVQGPAPLSRNLRDPGGSEPGAPTPARGDPGGSELGTPYSCPWPPGPGFLPARARPLLGAGGGGVAFPGGAASLAPGHSDSALTDRHQMLFRAALRSARRFRFSIDRRKPGKGESVDVTSPQPQARGWGPGRDGCQTVRIWSFANRGGWGNVTSPRVSLSAQQS